MKNSGIVIDACVARSSGRPTLSDNAARCALCIDNIGKSSLTIWFDRQLFDEWDEHASNFSRKFLFRMVNADRVKIIKCDRPKLRKYIQDLKLAASVEREILKDTMLIEIATSKSSPVISLEAKSRDLMLQNMDHRYLVNLAWVHPYPECDCMNQIVAGKFPIHCLLVSQ